MSVSVRICVILLVAPLGDLPAQDAVRFVPITPLNAPLLRDCDGPPMAQAMVCRLREQLSTQTVRGWLRDGWIRQNGDTLRAVAAMPARSLLLCCGVQAPLSPVGDSTLWTVTLLVPRLREARLSLGLLINDSALVGSMETWRGPAAPPASPALNTPLHGTMRVDTIDSPALGEARVLTIYVPPKAAGTPVGAVYLADGAAVTAFASDVDALIAARTIRPVVLIGVHSGQRTGDGTDPRILEYIDVGGTRYLAHERFFTQEVPTWAQARLGIDPSPARQAVWGASNSGFFALQMGLRHPDVFGHALGFSPAGRLPEWPEDSVVPRTTRFQISSGTLEPSFTEFANAWHTMLVDHDVPVHQVIFVGGHDQAVWREEFPDAVRRAFMP